MADRGIRTEKTGIPGEAFHHQTGLESSFVTSLHSAQKFADLKKVRRNYMVGGTAALGAELPKGSEAIDPYRDIYVAGQTMLFPRKLPVRLRTSTSISSPSSWTAPSTKRIADEISKNLKGWLNSLGARETRFRQWTTTEEKSLLTITFPLFIDMEPDHYDRAEAAKEISLLLDSSIWKKLGEKAQEKLKNSAKSVRAEVTMPLTLVFTIKRKS